MNSNTMNMAVAIEYTGEEMTPRLVDGDLVVLEVGRAPQPGDVVACTYEGEVLVRRYSIGKDGTVRLVADNPAYPVVEVEDPSQLDVAGVITRIVAGRVAARP